MQIKNRYTHNPLFSSSATDLAGALQQATSSSPIVLITEAWSVEWLAEQKAEQK
jgi:hypothetical protein